MTTFRAFLTFKMGIKTVVVVGSDDHIDPYGCEVGNDDDNIMRAMMTETIII